MMKRAVPLVLLALTGLAQQVPRDQGRPSGPKPITPFDSDASPAKREVDTLIQQGAKQDRTGDYAAAIKTFEHALDRLRALPEMKNDEDSLLVRLGRAYIGARRLDDAVRTFALLLGPKMEDCRQGVAALEYCADAQYYIGFCDMQRGKVEAAIPILTRSAGTYGRAASESQFVESRMIKIKQQAEAETLLAAALQRTGSNDRAIAALRHAIDQLTTVEQNVEIQDGIRASARKSREDARTTLNLISKK
jgi:tetratricopeptide (TPR) repeat protein